ncbi:hypothetical protein M404DRAFT_31091 [Pisolithus tinctorius Marx 270]|uniref:Uncharacterized protein n=1 Tax=Pisolithus tinctorius Marx 270 TaxID=870435 RepID=A0A0C3NU46_PISTI|nr:hypothetical protein M404DRAFT_31091 [Pisolithus tinctorius Marx 270]
MSYTPNTENPGSDYFDNDFHANIDKPYDPSHPYFDCYASTPPHLSEPPVCPHRALCSPSPMISSHSSYGGTYQPLHNSVTSTTHPYPYPVIHSVPSSQRACKDAHKGKSKARLGPPEPCYDTSFRSCGTPLLFQAGYKSPSPVPHAGPSTPTPSVTLAVLSAPAAVPAAPASSTSRLAPKASLFLSVAIAGRRLYWAKAENTSRPSQMPLQQSPSMELPATGSTSLLRPEEIPLEGPSSMLLRHHKLSQLLPSSQFLSPPSAKENLVGSFPSIGSIPCISSPATGVHALDIGRLTAQLVVATNSEIRSWIQQGLYPPSEDLRP